MARKNPHAVALGRMGAKASRGKSGRRPSDNLLATMVLLKEDPALTSAAIRENLGCEQSYASHLLRRARERLDR